MSDGQVDTMPADTNTATPIVEPVTGSNGTVETAHSEATQAAAGATSVEESFTQIDPNTLPPQLKAAYNNMLTDYKKKTQEIAAKRKDIESLSQKASLYDRIAPVISDEKFVNYWQKLSKGEQEALKTKVDSPEGVNISDEEWIQAFGFVPENKDKVASLINKIHGKETAEIKAKNAELENKQKIQEAKTVLDDFIADGHEDFDKLEKYKFISYQLMPYGETLAPSQYKRVVADAYAKAKEVYEEIYNLGKQEALGIIKTKQNNATLPPSNTDANVYSGNNPKKLSAAEAVALARQGKRVPDTW